MFHRYERVAVRVLGPQDGNSTKPQKAASTILEWVVGATRPLRWREIQALLCIDVSKEICNVKRRRLDTCKETCSSFIEVEACAMFPKSQAESFIHLVHDTARR